MIRLAFRLAADLHLWLQGHAPTNRFVSRVRAKPTLANCAISLGLGLGCLLAAATLSGIVQQGAPGWVNIPVIVFIFDGIKLLLLAPASLVWNLTLHRRNYGQR